MVEYDRDVDSRTAKVDNYYGRMRMYFTSLLNRIIAQLGTFRGKRRLLSLKNSPLLMWRGGLLGL